MTNTNPATLPAEAATATAAATTATLPANQPAVAIVGYGIGGVNALIGLRQAGYDGPIRVFSDTDTIPYSPILTSYFAGGEKTYDQCFPWSEAQLETLGHTVLANCPVTGLDTEARVLRTAQGDFPYTKCILATGASAATWGFPQVEGYSPIVLRTLDDGIRMKDALTDPACKRVLLSGASMVALKMLEACLNQGLDCSLVGMMPHVLDVNALPEIADVYEGFMRDAGVNLRLGTVIQSVRILDADEQAALADAVAAGEAPAVGRLEVTFKNGDVDYFDEILVAHGVRSNLGFLEEGQLNVNRAIPVDEFMRTCDPDVYAIGDIASSVDLVTGDHRVLGIYKTAALQGQCAGAVIAAELAGQEPAASLAYPGGIPMNTISLHGGSLQGALFISAGTIREADNRRFELEEKNGMLVARIWQDEPDGTTRLVGFNLVTADDVPGGPAYELGAMLLMRIEKDCR